MPPVQPDETAFSLQAELAAKNLNCEWRAAVTWLSM